MSTSFKMSLVSISRAVKAGVKPVSSILFCSLACYVQVLGLSAAKNSKTVADNENS